MAFKRGQDYYWYSYKFVLRSGKYIVGYSHFHLPTAIRDHLLGRPADRFDDHSEMISIPAYYQTRGLIIKIADIEYIEIGLAIYPKEEEEQQLLGQ